MIIVLQSCKNNLVVVSGNMFQNCLKGLASFVEKRIQ